MEIIYNDYELVSEAQEKNEYATSLLFQKYQPLLTKISLKYYKLLKDAGEELEDIIQECNIALNDAIFKFNEQEESKFYTFAKVCIENRIITMLRKSRCEKYKVLNESISIDDTDEEKEGLINIIKSEELTPEESVIDEENCIKIYQKIKEELTFFEECVICLKMQNYNYKEIASILDKKEKSIDNALQRIKTKIAKTLPH